MSQYIGSGQNNQFDVRIQEFVSKVQNPGGFSRKNVFKVDFCFFFFPTFVLLRGHFCTNLHEIMAQGLKLNFMITLFYNKKNILTNRSWVNDPTILAQKQPKVAVYDKTDFWDLKYLPEVRAGRT